MDDPYDLERFVAAQNAGHTYDHAVEELRRGRKTSHWMWFVFPQVAGLGESSLSRRYAISSLEEARAYLSNIALPFGLIVLNQAEEITKGSTPAKVPLAAVIALIAVSAGIATQQAAWHLGKLTPVAERPATHPTVPYSPEGDGQGGVLTPRTKESMR